MEISSKNYRNILIPPASYDLDVYLSYYNENNFFMNGRIAEKEPTWSERGLYYDSRPENERHLNVTIPVNDNLLKKNRTLYLHT